MEERIKIIVPGTCDYFRKVLIPSSLGTDTGEYAPKNGAYHNAIVEYEANSHVYIYSSDGIYTKIASAAADVERQIAEILVALGNKANTRDLARVAFTGEYADVLHAPTPFQMNEWNAMWQ